jgi:hypothetical protein
VSRKYLEVSLVNCLEQQESKMSLSSLLSKFVFLLSLLNGTGTIVSDASLYSIARKHKHDIGRQRRTLAFDATDIVEHVCYDSVCFCG